MGNSDLRQEWETPADFWKVIDGEFDFKLDACATRTNAKCIEFCSPFDDGLREQRWSRTTWCNPGFSNIGPWMQKARDEAERFETEKAVMVVMGLVNPSTKVWNDWGLRASEIRLLRPRVQFIAPPGVEQSSNMRENALFIFRWNPHRRPPDIWTWQWK